jgi:hypothetical protein
MDAGKQALRLMPRQGKVVVRRIRAIEGASVPAMAEADRRQAGSHIASRRLQLFQRFVVQLRECG